MAAFHKIKHFLENQYDLAQGRIFDWKWGVETRKNLEVYKLDTHSLNIIYSKKYMPTHPRLLKKVLRHLKLNWEEYLFIDLGCGKGRTLFIASEFPFKKILGIEFAQNLIAQGELNLTRLLRRKKEVPSQIQFIQEDVAQYKLPEGKKIIFLYNPFDSQILSQWTKLNRETLTKDDYIVFLNPLRGHILELQGIRKIREFAHSNHNKIISIYQAS